MSQPDLQLTTPSSGGPAHRPNVKRRVSRVESLRNLFFNRGSSGEGGGASGKAAAAAAPTGAERARAMLKKRRARSAEKGVEKVREKVCILKMKTVTAFA